ncbi:isochorismatase family protein [Chloroflexota bacterium]
MKQEKVTVTKAAVTVGEWVVLAAEPEPLEIDLKRTGVVIVDMQNGFVAKGAYAEIAGGNLERHRAAIAPIKRISGAARSKGLKVIYIKTVHHPGDAGTGPDSVFWHKEHTLVGFREHPEFKDKFLLPGTWGNEVVAELEPQAGDVIVEKPRYSGFFDTNLDTVLKRHNIKYLLTMGVATNCCVEATIRDAYYRGYFAILVSDAAASSFRGPAFMQEAAIYNIKNNLGWVTTTEDVLKAMA